MFAIEFLFFLFISILFFLNPGILIFKILTKEKIKTEDLATSFVLGISSYSLISLLFHYINIPKLSLFYVAIANIIFIKQKISFPNILINNKKIILTSIIILIGIIGQLLIISPSGIKDKNGNLIFFSSNGHDGSWHIALMNEIQKGFPLDNPSYAGEKLKNYHFLSDLAPSDINLFFKIPKIDLYFRMFPFIYSLALGILAYQIGKKISKTTAGGVWSVFFTYFAGSLGYIVTLIKEGKIGGETIFWSSQIQSLSGNPPQALALIIILASLLFISKYQEKNKNGWLILFIITASPLVLIKIYAFLALIISLGIPSLFQIIKDKKANLLFALFTTTIISSIIYIANTSSINESKSFLIFEPWWYIRTMIVEPSRLNLIDWELKRQTYLYEKNILRVIQIEIQSLIIFVIGNMGTRIISLYWIIKERKKIINNIFYQALLGIIIISFVFPLLFLQKGVAGNTIQTFQYMLLITGIIAGVSQSQIINLFRNKFIKTIFATTIIILSIPTQIALIYDFYSKPPLAKINKSEMEALEFFKEKTPKNSIIISPPFNQYSKFRNQETPEIWAWFDTSYIAAFSERKVFFADYEQMDIMGYDIKTRQDIQKMIFSTKDPKKFANILKENKIDYLYIPKELNEEIEIPYQTLNKVFENQGIVIWRLSQN